MTESVKDKELNDLKAIEDKHNEIMGDINILSDILALENKYGRNNICFCGSGKKFKKCCLSEHEEKERKLHDLHHDIIDVLQEYATLKAENLLEKRRKDESKQIKPSS
jgi:hypothetical protein